MKKITVYILASLFSLFATTLFASAAQTEAKPSEVEKTPQGFVETLHSINTMSGKFKQSLFDKDGTLLQEMQGDFKLKRPGYFLWHVAPPYEQTIVGTPDFLKVYDPDLEQMTIYPQNAMAGTPAALISGDIDQLTKNYQIAQKQENEQRVFTLSKQAGQADDSAFESLVFTFENKGKKHILSHIAFTDKLGQTTNIVMSKVKTNKKLSDKKFAFEPPKGTDIIIDG